MKKTAGFSIMELMVVIAIISILAIISTPNVFRWMSTQRFNSAVRDVQASIEYMRLYAVKENSQSTITFTDGANNYQTDKWKRGVNTHEIEVHELPAGVTISSNFTDGELVFSSRGMATPGVITINGPNGISLQITVNMTGSSRIS
jgi:prepilin-type N-terminal cleavage/methylation domain-containing protein